MPNQKIFCQTPWYEVQIYWDGSLGICCHESHKLYDLSQTYNVKTMSLKDWFNSDPVKQFRKQILGDRPVSACSRCYHEEAHSGTSRRHRANQKSVIFTKSAFAESYQQSPGFEKFEHSSLNHGDYDGLPIDLHIDLGNFCNLACKMCGPDASSTIASQLVQWGNSDARQYLGTDWTRDPTVWHNVLNQLANIKNLKNIHFMGGETLLTKKFEDFVDFMLAKNRTDLNFSFVTNGTVFNESLINKLKKFQRVGFEISIETVDEHNAYQRQGTNTDQVIAHIQQYLDHCNGTSITVTARPAVSALTIGYYWTLLEFCWQHKLMIKSLMVTGPAYLDVRVLPRSVKMQYLTHYQNLIKKLKLEQVNCSVDYNESDPNNLPLIIRKEIDQSIKLLTAPEPEQQDSLLNDMVSWCKRWDKVYNYDALKLYPELSEEFVKRGY